MERRPLIGEEHDAELTHDQVESAVRKLQLHRIGLFPIHSLHSRSELTAFDHWRVEIGGRDRHVGRKDACRASVTTPVPAAVSKTRRGSSAFARSATTSAYGAKVKGTR